MACKCSCRRFLFVSVRFCFGHVVGNGHLALVCRFVVGCCVFAPVVMLFVICAIVGSVVNTFCKLLVASAND